MASERRFGKRIRGLRLQAGLTQAALAGRLGISASYLNLLEHERRPLTTDLLIRLAQVLDVDLRTLAAGDDSQLASDLAEVFGDPIFEEHPLTMAELRELAASAPDVARAVLRLHHAYTSTRASLDNVAEHLMEHQEITGVDRVRLSSEEVSDLLQRRGNYFPDLEAEAERVWREGDLDREELFAGLSRYLDRKHGVVVRIATVREMGGAVRRFDPARGELRLSEVLRRGSRNFQLASQVGLLECGHTLDRYAADPQLTSAESRKLSRVALASYFASAVLMPYADFLRSAEEVRYDLELLGHRFRASFEQVCHRLTTLRRSGAEGVPFQMVRVDIAGNISKKFSATGIRLPRFGGLCPLWNVHSSFLQPGMIRVQLSRLPDGNTFFSVARTVRRHSGDWHTPAVLYAIGLGCDVSQARRLVYSDGMDLTNTSAAVPVGVTCRLCTRIDCGARALPPLQQPLRLDENVRGSSFYAPVK